MRPAELPFSHHIRPSSGGTHDQNHEVPASKNSSANKRRAFNKLGGAQIVLWSEPVLGFQGSAHWKCRWEPEQEKHETATSLQHFTPADELCQSAKSRLEQRCSNSFWAHDQLERCYNRWRLFRSGKPPHQQSIGFGFAQLPCN